jgi:hypothetical protein
MEAGDQRRSSRHTTECLVQHRNITVQEEGDPADQEKWVEQRLYHNVKGILRDITPPVPLSEQLYRQGRKWFQDNKVGQFLDKLNKLVRQPEFVECQRWLLE